MDKRYVLKSEGMEKQKIPPPLNLTHSINEINIDNNLSPINSLDQENKLHKNRTFSLWSKSSTFSKDLLYCSFQIIQKKRHKSTGSQTFFCFLLTKESCQPNRVSLTEECITQEIPKRENKSCHNILALLQCRRIWSINSSRVWHETSIGQRSTSLL